MIKYMAVAPQMASWSERLWQAAIAFLVILCIVLGILEVWALFYRESKGKVIEKEVCILGWDDFHTEANIAKCSFIRTSRY